MAASDPTQETKTTQDGMSAECSLVVSLVKRAGGNFYEVLGFENKQEFTPDEVEHAFRGIAPAVHPKHNPFPEARAAFKSIFQAFCVLSDPERKKQYDELGRAGLDLENLNPAIDIMDILKHGQNLRNVPSPHMKILEAEDDLYGVISGGAVNKQEGRSLTKDELMKYFQETESGLSLCDDIEHASTFSLCCNKLQLAWEVLSDEMCRKAYDADEEERAHAQEKLAIPEESAMGVWIRATAVTVLLICLVYLWMQAGGMRKHGMAKNRGDL